MGDTTRRSERHVRVLVVLSSDARRGAEIEGHRLAQEISDGGVTVDVVALTPSGSHESLGVNALGPSALGIPTLRALRRRARQVDLVIAFGSRSLPGCAIAMFGLRTPFVYRSIGDPSAWAHDGWRRRRTGWLMRRAAAVVALWPGGEHAVRSLYGVDRTTAIPNARSERDFRPALAVERTAARDQLGLVGEEVAVLWVGAFAPEKRLGVAIHAISALPDDHVLIVVGDGPRRAEFEAEAQVRLGDRCRFVGSRSDMGGVYAAADLVLSTSSTEGMPGVVIEAGLCGLPVVATDVGAVPWLFERGVRGVMCRVDDSAEVVAQSILRARNPSGEPADERDRGGDAEVARLIDACGWDAVATQWRRIFENHSRSR